MSKVAILIVFFLFVSQGKCVESVNCSAENDTCATCFHLLVRSVINPEQNQYNMQRVFFPPNTSNPVYVAVRYNFVDESREPITEKLWFWSESTYYASFHPLQIYQFTSLFFGVFYFRKADLTLTVQVDTNKMDCDKAGSDFMRLLTQRLKLFAMSRSSAPKISDSYDPKAESSETVKDYHGREGRISGLLFSAQIIFPPITLACTILLIFAYHYYNKDENYANAKAKSVSKNFSKDTKIKLSIVFTLSFYFSLYTFILSTLAVHEGKNNLDEDSMLWFNRKTHELKLLYGIVITILVEDVIIFAVLFGFMLLLLVRKLIVWYCFKRCLKDSSCCYKCYLKAKDRPFYRNCCLEAKDNYLWYFCAFSMIAPALHLSVHVNHIAFAFIHNQEHAISVAIFYGIVIITNVIVMHVVSKYISIKTKNKNTDEANGEGNTKKVNDKVSGATENAKNASDSKVSDVASLTLLSLAENTSDSKVSDAAGNAEEVDNDVGKKFDFVILAVNLFLSLLINGLYAYIAAIYVLLPINNAYDAGPDRIRVVYNTVIATFIGIFTYGFFKKEKKDGKKDEKLLQEMVKLREAIKKFTEVLKVTNVTQQD